MNILFTVVAAVTIGYFVRGRGLAVVGYVAADAFVFVFQTLDVLLHWMSGGGGIGGAKAFGEFPLAFPVPYSGSDVLSYGVVNGLILLVGIGIVVLTHRWADRRRARRSLRDVVSSDVV